MSIKWRSGGNRDQQPRAEFPKAAASRTGSVLLRTIRRNQPRYEAELQIELVGFELHAVRQHDQLALVPPRQHVRTSSRNDPTVARASANEAKSLSTVMRFNSARCATG
jgi:hypothetical protein